ncbi:hypothetical protein ACFVWN_30115 [Nocardiopsis flavescens]|uniref:hypothetical protein n=1 Tax=Nocardiopsis flavescens TaxID=758803 RepID=UPI003655E9E8
MRVKPRMLIIAAMAAAFFGAAPALAADDPADRGGVPAAAPADSVSPVPAEPDGPREDDAPIAEPPASERPAEPGAAEPERPAESDADPARPIREEPNYTG